MTVPRVSIIIPIFNVSTSVFEECFRSVSEQTTAPFEVIVIDDGNAPSIAGDIEELCQHYDFQLLKNSNNLGVSRSRNLALGHACCDYVCFIDADDCVYPDFLSEATRLVNATNADCVIGMLQLTRPDVYLPVRDRQSDGYRTFDGSDVKYVQKGTLAGKDFMPVEVSRHRSFVHAGPCGRLYRKDIAEDTLFDPNIVVGEDILFNLAFLERSDSCVIADRTWYQYKQHALSVTNNLTRSGIVSHAHFCSRLMDIALTPGFDAKQEAYGRVLATLKVIIGKGVVRLPTSRREKRKEIATLLELDAFAQSLDNIDLEQFELSVKDRVFVTLCRRQKYGMLLDLFSTNNKLEVLRGTCQTKFGAV